jgi:hypothetical protein
MPKPEILNAKIAQITSTYARYKPVSYFLNVTPSADIPKGGYLQVSMPLTVRLPLGVH